MGYGIWNGIFVKVIDGDIFSKDNIKVETLSGMILTVPWAKMESAKFRNKPNKGNQ